MLLLLFVILLFGAIVVMSEHDYRKGYTGASSYGTTKIRCYYCQRFHGPICSDKLAGKPATPIPPRPPAPMGDRVKRQKRRGS